MSRNPHRQRKLWERVLEIVPASLTWGTFAIAIYLSATHPAWAAVYIIVLDLYWISKAFNSTAHMLHSFKRYQKEVRIDWQERLQSLPAGTNYQKLYHVVLFPFVDEPLEVLQASIEGIRQSSYDKNRIIIALAAEERAGEQAQIVAQSLKEKYQNEFSAFLVSTHPDGLPGEIRGKSANASYAMEHMVVPYIKEKGIEIDDVVVSNFDSDTVAHPQYLARITYEWCTSEKPHRASYQPIAVYNNNIWESPSWVRVVAVANTFWLLIEASRPDRMVTFSSHSMSLRALVDVGYWKKDVVNEDGSIFFQCFFRYDGDYEMKPIFVPVSMDTVLYTTYRKTLVNQYKQRKRWAYNVEIFPWITKNLFTNNKIPFWKKAAKYFMYVEGNYHWATASIVLASMGFLPAFLGHNFTGTVFGYNLPVVTQWLLTFALLFLVFYVYVNIKMLPPKPEGTKWTASVGMYLQWILTPPMGIFWLSLPAIDAQTRLALGKYMEFWVTPKARQMGEQNVKAQMPKVKST